jgi:lipid II:glycine glycyltransferase (peptidoglycan interpeptide bridge formation enzyme)
MDYADAGLLDEVLAVLEADARRCHSLWIKIDPDLWLGCGAQAAPPEPAAAAALQVLQRRGWRESAEQIQFKNTVVVDLAADHETLLAAMKPKTRYNIRLAERKGVQVRAGQAADLAAFYTLYQQTSQRDGFLIRPFAYYRDVWSQFLAAGRAHVLLAEVQGVPTAGLLLFVFGRTAWYLIGASSTAGRELMPSHLLQWEAIRLARQLGCTRYDMWGAPDRLVDNDPMWGVYRFKTGFGGQTVRGLGAYDYAPYGGLYWGYTVAMPGLLALMRRRHARLLNAPP